MAQRTVYASDLTGKDIPDGERVEVRVLESPDLNMPVKLDASKTEADRLRVESTSLTLLELVMPDGETVRIAIPVEQFKKSIKGDADEVLANAEGLSFQSQQPEQEAPRRGRRPRGEGAAAPKTERVDYTSVEHAGSVKRGIVSDGEKQTVREHFDEVNRNLEAAGQRQIDLSDIAMVEKYGLQELAAERGITPAAKLCDTKRSS